MTKGVEDGMGDRISDADMDAYLDAKEPRMAPEQPSMSTGDAAADPTRFARMKHERDRALRQCKKWENAAMKAELRLQKLKPSLSPEMEQLLREIHGEHDRNSAYGRCACWACIRIDELLDHIEGKGNRDGS